MVDEPDDDADAEFSAAIGVLLGDRPKVAEAYRRLWHFLMSQCVKGSPVHAGHFSEAMALILGEIIAESMPRDDWPQAFEAWRRMMAHAAECRHAN
jgi:hypothetical protein